MRGSPFKVSVKRSQSVLETLSILELSLWSPTQQLEWGMGSVQTRPPSGSAVILRGATEFLWA